MQTRSERSVTSAAPRRADPLVRDPSPPTSGGVNPMWARLALSSVASRPTAVAPSQDVGGTGHGDGEGTIERAADHMAEQALAADASPSTAPAAPPSPPPNSGGPAAGDLVPSTGQALDAGVRRDFEGRFGHDFSAVRVHTGERAAESARRLGAVAFATGQHIGFARGAFAPGTEAGRRLLAHELAHTVQHAGGITGGRVHLRRVPSSAHLAGALPPAADTVGVMHARTGLTRVLTRSWASLNAADQATVRTAAAGFGVAFTNEADLRTALGSATRDQLISFAAAVRAAKPARELGDPALIDIGPRPATVDAANLALLTAGAITVFVQIASGIFDASLGQVFGAANVGAAKTKYANAMARMNVLFGSGNIVTDRSGYSQEVALGGLTNSDQISLAPGVIDNPVAKESIVTMIHESMHAGNSDVDDSGYIDQPSFTALTESEKLTNAAHFEVVPRRILGAGYAFAGQTFIPAGTTVGGVSAPALTPRQQAIRDATEEYRSAWTAGLNLHSLFVHLFRNPSDWSTLDLGATFTGAEAGSRFSTTLPFWSRVEMLTMHSRLAHIDPGGAAAVHPVTIIDVALSEGLVRKLAQGMGSVPRTEADAGTFETAHGTTAERTAAGASSAAERDLLIRLVIRAHLGSITGDENRDVRAVAQLARADRGSDFAEYLKVRTAASFP